MEFKEGDKVKRNDKIRDGGDYSITNKGAGIMEVTKVSNSDIQVKTNKNGLFLVDSKYFELVSDKSSINKTTMEKKILKVLIVDKKTGKTLKDENVVAENEQQAILKSFGIDAENSFIRVDELGKFEVKEPVIATIEKKKE